MPIPDYQSIMLPLLKQVSDGQEHKTSEVKEKLAKEFKLTHQDKKRAFTKWHKSFEPGWLGTNIPGKGKCVALSAKRIIIML